MNRYIFSIIIPARNEEFFLGKCLDALAVAASSFRPEDLEIIVVLNRCTDRTEAIAKSYGCIIVHDHSRNLARIRNRGARLACGKILITVDADSIVSANMLQSIRAALDTGKVIGGGVLILPARWSLGILLTALCLMPIAIWHRISAGLFFCYRDDFNAIGGFNEDFCSVEDIDFARRLRAYGSCRGKKFVTLFRASITTSCRKFDKLGDWYFLRKPLLFIRLLRGRNQQLANQIWYDFER